MAYFPPNLLELTPTPNYTPHCVATFVYTASGFLVRNVSFVYLGYWFGVFVVVQYNGFVVYGSDYLPVVKRRESRPSDDPRITEVQAMDNITSTRVSPFNTFIMDVGHMYSCDKARIEHSKRH
ncbi:hypothetical protein Plhal304r1_c010g0038951 [Plasmopara halstedii]